MSSSRQSRTCTASKRSGQYVRIQIVGRGRMGRSLTAALLAAGADVAAEPSGHGSDGSDADVVILAVPDGAIADAAGVIAPGRIVGHMSGATTLAPLAPHEAFSLHPLITVTGADLDDVSSGGPPPFSGVPAAVAATTPRALGVGEALAAHLGMRAFTVADEDRAAYHAAASIASNFLVTVEGVAETLAATAGVPRDALVPLVRAAASNWAEHGAAGALTGPVVRGDDETVERQRRAVSERMPGELALFDALVSSTRSLAARVRGTELHEEDRS